MRRSTFERVLLDQSGFLLGNVGSWGRLDTVGANWIRYVSVLNQRYLLPERLMDSMDLRLVVLIPKTGMEDGPCLAGRCYVSIAILDVYYGSVVGRGFGVFGVIDVDRLAGSLEYLAQILRLIRGEKAFLLAVSIQIIQGLVKNL